MTAFAKVSIPKGDSNNNPGRAKAKKSNIILFDWDDVSNIDAIKPNDNGIIVSANIEMKAGKTAIAMYATPSTIKITDPSEGDPDKKGFKQGLEYEHPNTEDQLYAEFIENNINKNFGAIVVNFESGLMKLIGTPAVPMQIMHESDDSAEQDTNIVKMESLLRGPKVRFYTGALPVLDTDEDASGSGA
jgi:hypothetical protein